MLIVPQKTLLPKEVKLFNYNVFNFNAVFYLLAACEVTVIIECSTLGFPDLA